MKALFKHDTGLLTLLNANERNIETGFINDEVVADSLVEVEQELIDQIDALNTLHYDGEAVSVVARSVVINIPKVVTAAQFKCALGATRFAEIEAELAAITDANVKYEYTQYWLNTTEFAFNHPMVETMQGLLGWSDADKDQLFIDAGNK